MGAIYPMVGGTHVLAGYLHLVAQLVIYEGSLQAGFVSLHYNLSIAPLEEMNLFLCQTNAG